MKAWRVALGALMVSGASAVMSAPAEGPNSSFTGRDLFDLSSAADPRISPDGRRIAYVRRTADIMTDRVTPSIWLVDVATGEQRPVATSGGANHSPRWSPDGRRLYFVSNRTGFFNVWGIGFDPASGQPRGEPFRVTNFESPARMVLPDVATMEMALAADRIVLPIIEVSGGIWILENVGR